MGNTVTVVVVQTTKNAQLMLKQIYLLDILNCSGFPAMGVGGPDSRPQPIMEAFTASHGRKTGTVRRQAFKQVLFNRTRTSCPRFSVKRKKTVWPAVFKKSNLLMLLCAANMTGCAALSPSISRHAEALGFQRAILPGKPFKHVAFVNGLPCANGQWHVYLDGDGRAWLTPHRVARDPTPSKSFLLDLMQRDPAASIYLGRPCYHGLNHSSSCNPWVWTQQRYSRIVVDSMVHALKSSLPDKACRIVLIGYSGGGTLAMLMAAQLPQVRGVVTLAGNLDVTAWTRLHGFSPLTESLDPARQPALPEAVFQIHVTGTDDKQIPPELVAKAIKRYPHAKFLKVKNLNHQGNWPTIWPEVLREMQQFIAVNTGRGTCYRQLIQ